MTKVWVLCFFLATLANGAPVDNVNVNLSGQAGGPAAPPSGPAVPPSGPAAPPSGPAVPAGQVGPANTGGQPTYGSGGDEWQSAWGNLRAAFRNVGDWFTRQGRTMQQSVQGWFANSQQELDRKVQEMVNLLGQVKNNADALAQGANQQLQSSLQNVTRFYDDVVQFQNKIRNDASANFQALQTEWQNKVQNMYNGGLDKVVNAAQTAKAGPPPAAGSAQTGQAVQGG